MLRPADGRRDDVQRAGLGGGAGDERQHHLRAGRPGGDRLHRPGDGEEAVLRVPPGVGFEVPAGPLQQDMKKLTHIYMKLSTHLRILHMKV